ncbi:MAG: hypothetical protein H6538_00775 [Bacteroidales bacterium]|nr:hypothetical protein [Bacteroidales bacterium]MCB9012575.1 hypothetical protein [Bacteroidales bacterium]
MFAGGSGLLATKITFKLLNYADALSSADDLLGLTKNVKNEDLAKALSFSKGLINGFNIITGGIEQISNGIELFNTSSLIIDISNANPEKENKNE